MQNPLVFGTFVTWKNVLERFQHEGIGHYRNVTGLGKSMVVFRLFEKLRYSNERSTIF